MSQIRQKFHRKFNKNEHEIREENYFVEPCSGQRHGAPHTCVIEVYIYRAGKVHLENVITWIK